MGAKNPIQSVTPCNYEGTATGPAVTNLPAPAKYKYGLKDISGSEAGRTEDLVMNKMRKGQSDTYELLWVAVSIANCSAILQAFNPEYVLINCLDAKAGTWVEKRFYVGDRVAPLYNSALGLWESVGFTIVQQDSN